jgi:hypothetical protein
MRYISEFQHLINDTLNLLKVYHLLGAPASVATKVLCGTLPKICQFGEGFLITQNPWLDDPARFQDYMGHFPAGASTQSLIHYAQMIKRNDWKLFDWGSRYMN